MMNPIADALLWETKKPVTVLSPNHDLQEKFYKIWLRSWEAIEIHISNLTHPSSRIEMYDMNGTRLTETGLSPQACLILPFFPAEDAFYFIKVTIGPDPDPSHVYQMHIDKYIRLSGTIDQACQFSAQKGPYMIGPEDLVISAGIDVVFEAGSSINVRRQNKIVVKDGASVSFKGEADRPIMIIGAIDDAAVHRWSQLSAAPMAKTEFSHVIVQYDNDENGVDFLPLTSPYVAAAATVDTFQADIVKTSYVERAGIIPPPTRLEFIKTWFQQTSPYRFSIFSDLLPFELYFGIDVATFAHWEQGTLRVNEERSEAGHINYWDFVNGNFTSDLAEAANQFADNGSSPDPRIQRFIDFLLLAQGWRQKYGCFKWYDLLDPFQHGEEEFQKTFEQMSACFWLAHNTSIIYWDKMARELGILQREPFFEQQFINSVIIRLHFAADLPFTLPGYGNNIPPVGFLGISINYGPFRYPEQYPAPEPEGDVNYGSVSTASYVKFLFESLIKGKTNPVYTWWLPTQCDKELFHILDQKGISLDSPPEDWDREFVQTSQKTLEEIQAFYLGYLAEHTW